MVIYVSPLLFVVVPFSRKCPCLSTTFSSKNRKEIFYFPRPPVSLRLVFVSNVLVQLQPNHLEDLNHDCLFCNKNNLFPSVIEPILNKATCKSLISVSFSGPPPRLLDAGHRQVPGERRGHRLHLHAGPLQRRGQKDVGAAGRRRGGHSDARASQDLEQCHGDLKKLSPLLSLSLSAE